MFIEKQIVHKGVRMKTKVLKLAVVASALSLTLTACATSAGGEESASGQLVDVAEYQKAAEQALQPVTEFTGPTTGPAAVPGKKVMVLACGFAADGCKGPSDAAPEAAEALGWEATVVDGQFDPQIYNRTISQAIDQNYDAILLIAVSDSAIAENLKRARDAGIVVGSWDGANQPSETGVSFEVDQPLAEQGTNVANYMIWKADGKLNAQVLVAPEFNVVTAWSDAFAKAVEDCSSCKLVREDKFTAGDAAGRLPTLVTQSLRQNPEINGVSGGYDAAMLSTIPAIDSAGLGDQAMIGGYNGIPAFLQFIRDGQATVTSAVANKWGVWAAFDNMNRIFAGSEVVPQNIPTRLLAAENIDQIPANEQWGGDVDYKAEFIRIWSGGE